MTAVRSSVLLATALVLVSAPAVLAGPAADVPTLVDVRAGHRQGFDRIIFEFEGGLPASTSVEWVKRVTQDGSGRPVTIQGDAFLLVSLHGVLGHEMTTPMETTYGPRARAFALPNVAHVVNAGDFEAVVSFGVGLMRQTRVLRTAQRHDPARFVVDVAAGFPTVPASVAFVEAGGVAPASLGPSEALALTARSVPVADRASGALLRLWAGPTADELAGGLRFESSRTKGFRDVRVSEGGVARLTLAGGCRGGGKAITVAEEIMATLKPFPEIEWVKVYDRSGQTQRPSGQSDSIPDCLAAAS
jgi:hypothetical protein